MEKSETKKSFELAKKAFLGLCFTITTGIALQLPANSPTKINVLAENPATEMKINDQDKVIESATKDIFSIMKTGYLDDEEYEISKPKTAGEI